MGDPLPAGPGQEGRPHAQTPSRRSGRLLQALDHQRGDRRLQQPHPGDQGRGEGLQELRALPYSNPILLRSPHAATRSHPLKSRKSRYFSVVYYELVGNTLTIVGSSMWNVFDDKFQNFVFLIEVKSDTP